MKSFVFPENTGTEITSSDEQNLVTALRKDI